MGFLMADAGIWKAGRPMADVDYITLYYINSVVTFIWK